MDSVLIGLGFVLLVAVSKKSLKELVIIFLVFNSS